MADSIVAAAEKDMKMSVEEWLKNKDKMCLEEIGEVDYWAWHGYARLVGKDGKDMGAVYYKHLGLPDGTAKVYESFEEMIDDLKRGKKTPVFIIPDKQDILADGAVFYVVDKEADKEEISKCNGPLDDVFEEDEEMYFRISFMHELRKKHPELEYGNRFKKGRLCII